MTFGGRNGRFKAYSLARLLRKLEQEQSVVSVEFCARVWLARLAADFCAVSVAAAAGARGAGPAGSVCAPDLPVLRSLRVCRRVSEHASAPALGPARSAHPRSESGLSRRPRRLGSPGFTGRCTTQ